MEKITAGLLLVGIAFQIAMQIFGKPKSIGAMQEMLEDVKTNQRIMLSQADNINRQLKAQWEKIDIHTEILVRHGQDIAVIKDRCDRSRGVHSQDGGSDGH